MTFDELVAALDADAERSEIAANIDLAELRGELTPEQAEELREILTPV